jgi:hypothetical protein
MRDDISGAHAQQQKEVAQASGLRWLLRGLTEGEGISVVQLLGLRSWLAFPASSPKNTPDARPVFEFYAATPPLPMSDRFVYATSGKGSRHLATEC